MNNGGPSGLGIWLWQVPNCDGGDWSKIINRCQRSGIKWIAPKAGEGGATPNHQWLDLIARGVLNALWGAGIAVFPWWYSRPSTWKLEVQLAARLQRDGVQGLIIDAEQEWQDKPADAPQFASELRNAVGAATHVGHAPFDYPQYHAGFPYSTFDALADSVHPQMYWTEHGIPVDTMMNQVDAQWQRLAPGKTCPVGVTYGSATQKEARSKFHATDLSAFLDHYAGAPAVSLYSYDAAEPECWDFLEERHSDAPTMPSLPPC